MSRVALLSFVIGTLAVGFLAGCSRESSKKNKSDQAAKNIQGAAEKVGSAQSGEVLFKQYCSSCHPNGGNVSDPSRPLYGSALRRNHITTPEDIVRIMRNPLSRMIRFDESTISDKDAQIIAKYVLKSFN
jgi:cytochrome c6